MAEVKIIGLKELRAAVARNPQMVLNETRDFLQRGLAVYKHHIINTPWRVGGMGGGAPVRTHNLRDTHFTKINGLEGRIGPDLTRAKYAGYVHQGTRRMAARPWLDYAKGRGEQGVRSLYMKLLKNIVGDLAK